MSEEIILSMILQVIEVKDMGQYLDTPAAFPFLYIGNTMARRHSAGENLVDINEMRQWFCQKLSKTSFNNRGTLVSI